MPFLRDENYFVAMFYNKERFVYKTIWRNLFIFLIRLAWGQLLLVGKKAPGRMELDMNRVGLEVSRTALVCGAFPRYFTDIS